jgi:hypothetical protein
MNRSILIPALLLLAFGCKESTNQVMPCQEITLGATFDANISETWCLKDESLKVTFSSVVEDGRCNVVGIECIWPGRFVMEMLIEEQGSQPYRDTLATDETWKGSIAISNYTLSLLKVDPAIRTTFDVDTADYQFQMVLE